MTQKPTAYNLFTLTELSGTTFSGNRKVPLARTEFRQRTIVVAFGAAGAAALLALPLMPFGSSVAGVAWVFFAAIGFTLFQVRTNRGRGDLLFSRALGLGRHRRDAGYFFIGDLAFKPHDFNPVLLRRSTIPVEDLPDEHQPRLDPALDAFTPTEGERPVARRSVRAGALSIHSVQHQRRAAQRDTELLRASLKNSPFATPDARA